jgi:hypothetical protein
MVMWTDSKIIFSLYAQLPTPIIEEDKILIFYSWKKESKSIIGVLYYDFNFNLIHNDPDALHPGEKGDFDDSGVMPSCALRIDGDIFIFYTGWHLRESVPYSQAIGVGKLNKKRKIERLCRGPIFSINQESPILVNSPFVYQENNCIKMIYSAGTHWHDNKPCYHLRSAISYKNFQFLDNNVFFKTDEKNECISRCCLYEKEIYFARKLTNTFYDIYFVENGNMNMINLKKTKWNNQMHCYPYVFDVNGEKILLYNGNDFGKTGIGMTKWKKDIF